MFCSLFPIFLFLRFSLQIFQQITTICLHIFVVFGFPDWHFVSFLCDLNFDIDLRIKVFPNVDAGATYIDSDTGLESMSSADATTKACSLCLDGDRTERSTNGGGSVISVSVGTGSTGGDSTRDLRCSTGSAGMNVSSCGGGSGGGITISGVGAGTLLITPDVMLQMDGFKQEITRLKCDKLDLLRQNVVSR